ncbi:MAG: NUDIX hydrolase [Caldilineaceae bacterium]|nr:NUDIX hydrolase [Caldilineaceae bacterium]
MQEWKTLNRRTVLRAGDGAFLSVEYHRVQLPDGRLIEEWPWVITPDYVNVLAETTGGSFICFRQTKYAADAVGLAIVGGYLEVGEEPLASAQRELLEETGYTAPDWISLGSYAVDGNRGCGVAHFFLARGATWSQSIDADDLEEQEMLLLNRDELLQALLAGQFRVLPWAAAASLALLHLQSLEATS